jgi:hypothetical protein
MGTKFFAGTGGSSGVYLSTDNGTNWTQTSLNNRNVRSLSINGNYVYAGTDGGGVYFTTNNGLNWTQTSLNNRTIYSIEVIGNNFFAGTAGYGVYVSNDNGTNWTQRNEGLVGLTIYSFCNLNNYIFAGTVSNGVYRRPLGELTYTQNISNEIPKQFSLSQNYPNPFNPKTNIRFSIPPYEGGKGDVILKVYDILGNEVSTLVNEQLKPGTYEVEFNGDNFASGVYYYTLQTESFNLTKRMVLLK